MGRGVSSGGGQSSLGYLFGSGEAPKPTARPAPPAQNPEPAVNNGSAHKSPAPSQPVDNTKQIPAGIHSNPANNYFRVDGQNSGNFITVVGGRLTLPSGARVRIGLQLRFIPPQVVVLPSVPLRKRR